ncbi:histidine phosphatase family protein [Cyanobium sp. CH-040]|uniref:SixA phosphatase family protein n=1 Tax=Cyanobium sp. CH-040 TaxID=2823708 RepID=UPI0020CF8172|nr:histidine phosphatase family protein [Cyanobium sp. CH-040]MCP9926759.1 histidine phosphatase family protein [Cyanobium sp. CH-040]
MTELLLLRHGIAEERCGDRDDAARALTDEGRERTRAVLARLVQLELGCSALVSSPLTRARQTAELACAAGLAPALQLHDGLAPGGDPWPLLRPLRQRQRLALVGHEPDLGLLAAALIGATPGSITLKKAGVALLELEPAGDAGRPRGRLRLLMGPRQLLAGS